MKSVELMMAEHQEIKKMLVVIRSMCLRILNNEKLDYNDFYKVIDFVRNYADRHHHSKEEEILFKQVVSEMDEKIGKGPITGMLIEHDNGRLFMQNLENALKQYEQGDQTAKLDIIANAISYADLLTRHIEKEDTVIYVFAEKNLSEEGKKLIEDHSEKVENDALMGNIQEKYLKILNELKEKYEK